MCINSFCLTYKSHYIMIWFEYQTIFGGSMKTNEIKELINLLETNNLTQLSYKDKDIEISVSKEGTSAPVVHEERPVSHKNTVVSPLVGIYYSKPSPEEVPFLSIGQEIKVGDVICIIEAMKVMSEIKSDKS